MYITIPLLVTLIDVSAPKKQDLLRAGAHSNAARNITDMPMGAPDRVNHEGLGCAFGFGPGCAV